MSQRSDIEALLEAGRGYDEIEDETGSQRSYIRSIAVQYRKRDTEVKTPEKEPEPEETPESDKTPSLNFIDDDDDEPVKKTRKRNKAKSGLDHHKEWVKDAKYECGNCGATIGKSATFCGHCGKSLEWMGIE